jgi:NAD(P)-dependent dehydrogenase (short-subunit alcohol dehydrogenase family)
MNNRGSIIITGCSGGIGRAVATLLIKDKWRLVGLDQSAPHKKLKLHSFHKVDLSEPDGISSQWLQIRKSAGKCWALIHCAGVYPIVRFADYTEELWNHVHAVNMTAAFNMVRLANREIQNGGRIIIVNSAAAFLGSSDIGYSASKSGLTGLVRSLAKNLAERGILVNAVCPGPVVTSMSARMSPKSVAQYLKKIPLRRFAKPIEVAVVVQFLVNPKNTYITGSSVDVSGGLALH